MKSGKKKTVIITVICIIVSISIVVMPIVSAFIYKEVFSVRYKTAEWLEYSVSDFEGLKVENCFFSSNKNQRLAGYKYYKENQDIQGIVVLAHGLGSGGHNPYMNIADFFTSNGYYVFAYDATGNGTSEGSSVNGLPQGIADLDYALQYVKKQTEYQNLPIMLFGHSWGAYSAASVLNIHSDIKAVVTVAGFDKTSEILCQQGKKLIGSGANLIVPYLTLYEKIKFGKYGFYNASNGFENSDAGVMILHSTDDHTVYFENGYGKFYEKYKESSRFIFVKYEDRGHNYVYNSDEAQKYRDELNKYYDAYVEANGGEYSSEIKNEFMGQNPDKAQCFQLDEALMNKILEFYNEYGGIS